MRNDTEQGKKAPSARREKIRAAPHDRGGVGIELGSRETDHRQIDRPLSIRLHRGDDDGELAMEMFGWG